jgi:hypothetical protein
MSLDRGTYNIMSKKRGRMEQADETSSVLEYKRIVAVESSFHTKTPCALINFRNYFKPVSSGTYHVEILMEILLSKRHDSASFRYRLPLLRLVLETVFS